MGSTPDPQRVGAKALFVREQLERIRALTATVSQDEFTSRQIWVASGARYALQTFYRGAD